jgi:hypothetical protein
MSETLNGSVRWEYASRDGGSYTLPSNAVADPFQQTINPMNISDRTRNKWRAVVDWSPVDRLALQFAYSDADDTRTQQLWTAERQSPEPGMAVSAWYSMTGQGKRNHPATVSATKFNDLRETDNRRRGVKAVIHAQSRRERGQFKIRNK